MPGETGVAAAPREPSIEMPAPGLDAGVISSLGTELAPGTSPWMVVSAIETDPVIPKPFSMAGVAKFVAGISAEPPGLSRADATLGLGSNINRLMGGRRGAPEPHRLLFVCFVVLLACQQVRPLS